MVRLVSTLRDNREYCAERRVSDKPACGNWLLKGIEPNAVAIPLPTFVLRYSAVKSRKPPGVNSAEPILNDSGELTIYVSGVKVTFLHYTFPPLLPLFQTDPVPMLSTKEILATKAYTIGRRGEYKDYVDLYAGLRGNHTSLGEIMTLARQKYGDAFGDRLFLEQLVYLDDVPNYPIAYVGKTIERAEIELFLRDAVSSLSMTG